jgi:Domain of unknown function (DUF4192)
MTTLKTPADLLTAIPFLIGYQPEASIVVVAVQAERIGLAMRIDFPKDFDPLPFKSMISHLEYEKSDSALLVFYLPPDADRIVCEQLAQLVSRMIARANIDVSEILLVQAERWWSLLCEDDSCCAEIGNALPNLKNSEIAAQKVFAGKLFPFDSRQEMESSLGYLAQDPFSIEIKKGLEICNAKINEDLDLRRYRTIAAENCAQVMENFIAQATPDPTKVSKFIYDLSDLTIRDYAFGITTEETKDQFWSFWLWLLRISPAGYRAPAATIFAALSYERGEGALANQSLEVALADDQKYSMAKLLKRTFAAGWPTSAFEVMRRELHPKICQTIFGASELELEESKE